MAGAQLMFPILMILMVWRTIVVRVKPDELLVFRLHPNDALNNRNDDGDNDDAVNNQQEDGLQPPCGFDDTTTVTPAAAATAGDIAAEVPSNSVSVTLTAGVDERSVTLKTARGAGSEEGGGATGQDGRDGASGSVQRRGLWAKVNFGGRGFRGGGCRMRVFRVSFTCSDDPISPGNVTVLGRGKGGLSNDY